MDKQEKEDCEEKQEEEEGQDESEVNEASDTSQHHVQETADQKKLESSEGVTCYDGNDKDHKDIRKSDEHSLMAGGNLHVRHTRVHHADIERGLDIPVEKTCESRKDLLEGDGFQASDREDSVLDLQKTNSSEDGESKRTVGTEMNVVSGMGYMEGQEEHHEEQSMNVLKGPGSEGQTETMQSELTCNEGNQHLFDNFEFIEDVDCIENTEDMKGLKNVEVDNEPSTEMFISDNFMEDEDAPTDGSLGKQALNQLFKMTIRFMLSLFFQFHNKYVTVCKTVLDQNNDQHTAVKRILHMGEFYQTGVFIDLLAVRIIVTPIPSEGRVEAFRWSTFVLAGLGLNFHISSRLAREGYFCNVHNYILCAFCGRYLNLRDLRQGQRHLDLVLECHRAHCDFHGNIPLDRYGYDLASHVANYGGTHILCISGMPYPQQGVCTYAQQVHNIGLQNLAPSGSRHNPHHHLLPQPNLVDIPAQVQERALNDGNFGNTSSTREPVAQPSTLVQVTDRENQPGNNGNASSTREQVALPSLLVQVTDRENLHPTTSSSSLTKAANASGSVAATTLYEDNLTGATGTTADLSRRSVGKRERGRRQNTGSYLSVQNEVSLQRSRRTSCRNVRYDNSARADVDSRIESFQTAREFHQTPQALALAGFFYFGIFGMVQCFSCGVQMDSWEEEDVPLLEHVREHPDCDYIQVLIRDSPAEQPDLVRAIVLALVDSSVGSEVLERGFRRPEVEQAIDRLIRRGVRVNVETVVRELRRARPT